MNPRRNKSVTLIELIIAIVLFSILVVSFFSIDIFSRHQVISSDRMAKLQNEASYVLEHMTKNISRAVGRADLAVEFADNSGVQVWIDANGNGKLDSVADGDYLIQYTYTGSGISYFADFSNSPTSSIVISDKITSFDSSRTDNYIHVALTACWDPDGLPDACGTIDNPQVVMETRIKMPSVSASRQ